jgi:hypothetical protein
MPRRALNVAPTDGSSKFNTIRIPLIPVACWRLNDPAFAFDSSFVSPSFRTEFVKTAGADPDVAPPGGPAPGSPLTTLSAIVAANPGCPAALFGHCDPAGTDALNKTLGDRRAIAIYALLTRQPDLWAWLHDVSQVGDTWNLRMVQTMLASVVDAQQNPYFAGGANGVQDADTTDAVKRFQADAGLAADGDPGTNTRKALYGAYMDWLCTPDGATTPFRMRPTDFLGGAGAQPGDLPKMSLQSCGKFNPIVLLSSAEMGGEDTTDGASKTTRNADDAPNRRAIMFLFARGTTVDTASWPCPKVKESNAACQSAFWPNWDSRRKNGDTLRLYKVTRDTMACRFYDRFARRSPCEGAKLVTFKYAVYCGDPWPDTTVLRIGTSDEVFTYERSFKDADDHSGDHAIFYLRGFPQNDTYSGRLVVGERQYPLFDKADLKRLISSDTAYTLLPSPQDPADQIT